jgi:hypothetical protein
MRETRSSGSVEGVISDGHSYSDSPLRAAPNDARRIPRASPRTPLWRSGVCMNWPTASRPESPRFRASSTVGSRDFPHALREIRRRGAVKVGEGRWSKSRRRDHGRAAPPPHCRSRKRFAFCFSWRVTSVAGERRDDGLEQPAGCRRRACQTVHPQADLRR